MSTPASTDASRWGRNGAPGSAFSNIGRGRGRPPTRGRGGRPARGAPAAPREAIEIDTKQASAADKPPAAASKPLSPSQPKSSPANSHRPRPPPRHPPRNSNAPAHSTAAASKDPTSVPSAAPRPSNRRRRSHANKPAPISTQKHSNLDDTNVKRSQKSSLSATPHIGPAKDLPPHLTPATDIRHNIDVLVERVRAVAMSDNRPSTPGSHIDWAGDDDDSLPDLDDWGIVTSSQSSAKKDVISPILMDGLKPLPEPGDKFSSPLIVRSTISTGTHTPSTSHLAVEIPSTSSHIHPTNDTSEQLASQKPTESVSSVAVDPHKSQSVARPLHPSLPPKPVVAPVANMAYRDGAIPMRGKGTGSTEQSGSRLVMEAFSSSVTEEKNTEDVPSIHAPLAGNPVKPSFMDDVGNAEEGLAASIHAPSRSSMPSSDPKLNQEPVLSHARAHTVGRFSRGSPVESTRYVRSGQSTPRGGYTGGFHSRTHSTPPTGTQRTHTSRPVITGDAISRLARTIGNASGSPPKPATIASGE